MHLIGNSAIRYCDDGTTDYVFPCLQPVGPFDVVPRHTYLDTLEKSEVSAYLVTLSEVRREAYMWSLFQAYAVPKINSGTTLRLNGTFTKKIYDHIREIYRELGYYDVSENRYRVPESASITLGIDLANLVYRPDREPSVYLSQ